MERINVDEPQYAQDIRNEIVWGEFNDKTVAKASSYGVLSLYAVNEEAFILIDSFPACLHSRVQRGKRLATVRVPALDHSDGSKKKALSVLIIGIKHVSSSRLIVVNVSICVHKSSVFPTRT
jgi:hypothetical protein